MVVAVVVHGPLAVEQQSVLTHLLGQRAVGAEVEVVAQVGVGVGLDTMLLGAALAVDCKGIESIIAFLFYKHQAILINPTAVSSSISVEKSRNVTTKKLPVILS